MLFGNAFWCHAEAPAVPDTFSETAVLMDADTGEVLYDKGMNEIRYPASITKLMSLLLAVENSTLDEQVVFTETGVRDVTPDSGNINMQVGEVLSMESCLYAMSIRSANEVSAQVAEYIGGTEAHFIEMMNQRAAELGCKNTHFVNASGLPDENHYSTAYDFALIMQAGLKNETFREILSNIDYTIPATEKSAERKLHTHLPLLAPESNLYYPECIGGKTGYTMASQNTMVVAAQKDGATYIVVTMKNADLGHNCVDSIALLDYAFTNFKKEITPTPIPTATPMPTLTVTPIPVVTEFVQPTQVPVQDSEETLQGLSRMSKILLGIMTGMIVMIIVLVILLIKKDRRHKKR